MLKRIISSIMLITMLISICLSQTILSGFAIVAAGKINGTVSIPYDAPAGGVIVTLTYLADGISTTVTIDGGTKSKAYEIAGVTTANSIIKYSLLNDEVEYCSNGYYKKDSFTYLKSAADFATKDAADVNIKIIESKWTISGKLTFPGADFAQFSSLNATIVATNQDGTAKFEKDVVISKGDSSVPFNIGVPQNESYSVEYVIPSASSEKNYEYIDNAFYSSNGTVKDRTNCTFINAQFVGKAELSLLTAPRIISGDISLPIGGTAPVGGLDVQVVAANSKNNEFKRMVKIPAGESKASFDLGVVIDNKYTLTYILQAKSDKYLVQAQYTGKIDVTDASRVGLYLKIVNMDCLITGQVSLPAGETAGLGGVLVTVKAQNSEESFFDKVVIPYGLTNVNYSIGVLVSKDTNFKISYEITEGGDKFINKGYYNTVSTTANTDIASTVVVNTDVAAKDLILLKKPIYSILSAIAIPDIQVPYGTAEQALALSQSGSVLLSNASVKTLPVTWQKGVPAYNPVIPGTYKFNGAFTITVADAISNPANIMAAVNVVVGQAPVDTVVALDNIPVEYGTIQSSISLPSTVTVILMNGAPKTLAVKWDAGTPKYTASEGTYAFNGTLVMADGVTNPLNAQAKVNVVVAKQVIQTPPSGVVGGGGGGGGGGVYIPAPTSKPTIALDDQGKPKGTGDIVTVVLSNVKESANAGEVIDALADLDTFVADGTVALTPEQKTQINEVYQTAMDKIQTLKPVVDPNNSLNSNLTFAQVESAIKNLDEFKKAAEKAGFKSDSLNTLKINTLSLSMSLPAEALKKLNEKGITIEYTYNDVSFSIPPNKLVVPDGSGEVKLKANFLKDSQAETLLGKSEGTKPLVVAFEATVDGNKAEYSDTSKIKVQIKKPLENASDADNFAVFYLKELADGKVMPEPVRSQAYNPLTGAFEFTLNHFSKYMIKETTVTFDDISNYSWAQQQIRDLAVKNVVSGMEPNKYSPSSNLTRVQFATMLVKIFGLYDETALCSYDDVTSDQWFYRTVASATKAGIVKGRTSTSFVPDALVTRAEMAVMMMNAAKAANIKSLTPDQHSVNTFVDTNEFPEFAKSSIAAITNSGIMKGYPENTFQSTKSATRAEAAVVIYNLSKVD